MVVLRRPATVAGGSDLGGYLGWALGDVHPGEDQRVPAIGLEPVASPMIPALVLGREMPDVAVHLDGELDLGVGEVKTVFTVWADADLDRRARQVVSVEEAKHAALEDTRVGGADETAVGEQTPEELHPRTAWAGEPGQLGKHSLQGDQAL